MVAHGEAVCDLVEKYLRSLGYTIVKACDGHEALQRCQQHDGPIHLLLTDVVMPRMGGCELVELLHPLYPNMKILYIFGHHEDVLARHGLEMKAAVLQKPFDLNILGHKVRALLDQAD